MEVFRLGEKIKEIVSYHDKLHGKNKKDFAITAHVMRETEYLYSNEDVSELVKKELKTFSDK